MLVSPDEFLKQVETADNGVVILDTRPNCNTYALWVTNGVTDEVQQIFAVPLEAVLTTQNIGRYVFAVKTILTKKEPGKFKSFWLT